MFEPVPLSLEPKSELKPGLFNALQRRLDRCSGYVERPLHRTKPHFPLVRDAETGIQMFTRGTPEIDLQDVFVQFPWGSELRFCISIQPKYQDRPFAGDDPSNPAILLELRQFERAVNDHHGTYQDNSKFVRDLLSGLSAINRHQPICRNPHFYSDLDDYKGRENMFPFSFPSNEELAKL
jgi:hypothetical protein